MNADLITSPNIDRPDDFYEALIEAHRELSDEESLSFNTRLILLLANHIGDQEIIGQALNIAGKKSGQE